MLRAAQVCRCQAVLAWGISPCQPMKRMRPLLQFARGLFLTAFLVFFVRGVEAAATAKLKEPVFSITGGVFTNDVRLELSTDVAGARVHYTLDGSEPGAASAVYSAPLLLTNSTMVRARVVLPGRALGPLSAQVYSLIEPDVASFDSNLPLVLVNTFGREMEKDDRMVAGLRVVAAGPGRALLAAGAADFEGRALINLRGRASLRYPKRSYTMKTVDAQDDPAKFSILDMPKESDWVLYAPYPDKTLMRDVLAYELSNSIGRWAPRTRFVELFLNESGERVSLKDYMGVYVMEERVKRDKNRVGVSGLEPGDNTEPKLTGGYIFKKDHGEGDAGPMPVGGPAFQASSPPNKTGFPTGPGGFPGDPAGFQPPYRGSNRSTSSSSSSSRSSRSRDQVVTNRLGVPALRVAGTTTRTIIRSDDDEEVMEIFENDKEETYFRSSQTNKFFYVDPEPDELTGVQRAWLQRHVNEAEAAIYGPDFKDAAKGYAAFLDADSFVDYHLLVEMTKNVDGFRFSTFYHKDRGWKIRMGPLWDWNLSFGNCNGKQGYMPEGWLWPQLDDKEYSWFRRLFEDPDFGQRYVDRWTELRAGVLATTNVLGRIDAHVALLGEAQARNFERWPVLGVTVSPNWFVGDTYADEIAWMKSWTSNRLEWIEKQFVAAPAATTDAAGRIILSVLRGRVFFTLDGSDPRASGGATSERAREFAGPVAVPLGKTLTARALHDGRWSGPLRRVAGR